MGLSQSCLEATGCSSCMKWQRCEICSTTCSIVRPPPQENDTLTPTLKSHGNFRRNDMLAPSGSIAPSTFSFAAKSSRAYMASHSPLQSPLPLTNLFSSTYNDRVISPHNLKFNSNCTDSEFSYMCSNVDGKHYLSVFVPIFVGLVLLMFLLNCCWLRRHRFRVTVEADTVLPACLKCPSCRTLLIPSSTAAYFRCPGQCALVLQRRRPEQSTNTIFSAFHSQYSTQYATSSPLSPYHSPSRPHAHTRSHHSNMYSSSHPASPLVPLHSPQSSSMAQVYDPTDGRNRRKRKRHTRRSGGLEGREYSVHSVRSLSSGMSTATVQSHSTVTTTHR